MATYSKFSSLINGVQRQIDLSSNTLSVGALIVGGSLLSASTGSASIGIAGGYSNFTPLTATVEGALAAIDTALGSLSAAGTFSDSAFNIYNVSDSTKKIKFSAAGIATGTTRTITMPDANVDLGNLTNSNIASGAAIAYSKLALTGSILNADLAGSIAYSKLILTGDIVNADISTSAAIAYSKLALTGSILNADLAGSIAYSKLILTGDIVNADISTSAAIAYSKLALTGSIVNADIASGAAIAYSKLALAASIVNADIASGAAIAVNKLAALTASKAVATDSSGFLVASSVTSTELGYVSGVTSAIQTQFSGKLSLSGGTMSGVLHMGSNEIDGLPTPTATGQPLIWDQLAAANGVATLDGSGKIPISQLPSVVMEYQGSWNPNTNTPALSDGTGTNGNVYWVSAADASAVAGLSDPSMINFQIGDLVIYSSALGVWQLVTPAAGVQSVNGAQGAVTVNAIYQLTGDITAGPASGSQSKAATIAAGAVTALKLGTVTDGITLDQSGSGSTLEVKAGGISNTQISASAAIAYSKLALTGDIVNSDISASAAIAYSKLALTGDIVNADISASAAIALSKLAALSPSLALVSDGSGVISVSAVTSTELGYVSGVTSAIQTQIDSKLTKTLAPADIFVGSAGSVATAVAVSGDVTIASTGAVTIAAGAVTASKLGTVTDGVTLDQSGSGSTLEIKALGVGTSQLAAASVTAAKLATGAFDQVTIVGGAGTAASVAQAPLVSNMEIAGESFAANTSFLVRFAITGETAGRVYKADYDTTSADKFWIIGVAFSAAGVSAGGSISVVSLGEYSLGSSDTAFSAGDIGKPIFLTASGAFSTTAPSSSLQAVMKAGMVKTTSKMFIMPDMQGIN